MSKCLFTFLVFLLVAFAALSSFAADFMIGGNAVEVSGPLLIKDSYIQFPDGTRFTSALIPDTSAIWGQISGLLVNQTDLNNALLLKEDKAQKGQIGGYASLDGTGHVPLSQLPAFAASSIFMKKQLFASDFVAHWYTQGAIWEVFSPDFSVTFSKLSDTSALRLTWSDNIGIYNPNWCNVGLFLDDIPVPACAGSWSGVPDTTIFNQQSLACVINGVAPGQHLVTVKHRSQYCMYGNYAFDDQGLNRFVSVEEF